jgi:putative transcriptional regulator
MDFECTLGGFRSANGEIDSEQQMKNSVPKLRAERGWTQGDLAKHLQVSRQSVNAVETGRYEPSLSLAFAIAKLFEKPVEEIFHT